METSTSHTTVFPYGDCIGRTQPYQGGHLGAVDVGRSITIQSTDPDHLLQLAEQLMDVAYAMERLIEDTKARRELKALVSDGQVPA